MNERGVVWITQRIDRLDYSDAERFGEIKFICDQFDEITAKESADAAKKKILEFSESFDSERDMILASGDPMIIASVFLYLPVEDDEVVKMVKWNSRTRRYYRVDLDP